MILTTILIGMASSVIANGITSWSASYYKKNKLDTNKIKNELERDSDFIRLIKEFTEASNQSKEETHLVTALSSAVVALSSIATGATDGFWKVFKNINSRKYHWTNFFRYKIK